eukprot:scaffold1007_cov364-Prasinococcus_capsulatus_cf.AAC.11
MLRRSVALRGPTLLRRPGWRGGAPSVGSVQRTVGGVLAGSVEGGAVPGVGSRAMDGIGRCADAGCAFWHRARRLPPGQARSAPALGAPRLEGAQCGPRLRLGVLPGRPWAGRLGASRALSVDNPAIGRITRAARLRQRMDRARQLRPRASPQPASPPAPGRGQLSSVALRKANLRRRWRRAGLSFILARGCTMPCWVPHRGAQARGVQGKLPLEACATDHALAPRSALRADAQTPPCCHSCYSAGAT